MKLFVCFIIIIFSKTLETSSHNIYAKCSDTRVFCMSLPERCIQQNITCNIILIASPVRDNDYGSVEFELMGRVDDSARWFAMGLSFDQQMGTDSVTEIFISNDGKQKAMRQSWNQGESNQVITDGNGTTQIGDISYSDGILRGKWRRNPISFVRENKFDILNNKFYILLAEGVLGHNNNKLYHTQKSISKHKIDLQSRPNDDLIALYSKCNSTYALCYGLPINCIESETCELIVGINTDDYNISNTTVRFEMIGKAGDGRDMDQYIAMGLSDDNQMGNDSVVECIVFNNGSTMFRNSWNWSGTRYGNDVISNVVGVVPNGDVSYDNGILSCKWSRTVYTQVKDMTFDLIDKQYYVLLAKGKLENDITGEKKYYSEKYYVSKTAVNLQSDRRQLTSTRSTMTTSKETITPSETKITATGMPSNLTDAYEKCLNNERLCFALPKNCIQSQDCKVLFSSLTMPQTNGTVQIELFWTRDTSSDNSWVAIGLSFDNRMGDDSVTECILRDNGTVAIREGWNPDNHRSTETVPFSGIEPLNASNMDGVIYCKWNRNSITTVRNNTFNILNDTFYLMLAYGPMLSDGNMDQHEDKIVSDVKVNLQYPTGTTSKASSTTESTNITTELPSTLSLAYKRCSNQERLCFGLPAKCVESENCKILLSSLSVSKSEGSVDMELFWMRDTSSGNRWSAMGLSTDKLMGEDSITECIIRDNGTVAIRQGWNPKSHEPTENVEIDGIQTMITSNINGLVYCKWRRSGITSVRKNTFNILNDTFYLILAYGPMLSDNNIAEHTDKVISDTQINLQSVGVIKGSGISILIKLHGTFMIIAWLGCVSIAIIMARHYKNGWPDTTLCGVKIWFAFHRALMLISVILIIVASIMIVSYRKGWSGASAHPILGVIAISLAILQPIGSLFRPNPNSSKRWIFNWGHWLAGNVAHIISFITILLACNFPNVLPKPFSWIMISYAIYYVISHLIHHLHNYIVKRKESDNYAIEDCFKNKFNKENIFYLVRIILNTSIISGFVITLIALIFI